MSETIAIQNDGPKEWSLQIGLTVQTNFMGVAEYIFANVECWKITFLFEKKILLDQLKFHIVRLQYKAQKV